MFKIKNGKFIIITLLVIVLVGLLGMVKNTQLVAVDFVEKYNQTNDAILLDVRTPQEFLSGHIDGAINIDFENNSFPSQIDKLDKSKTYFVYCRSGNRSEQAISVMKSKGIKNIYELKGGIISNKNSINLVSMKNTDLDYVVDKSDMVDGQKLISNNVKSILSDKEIKGLVQMREEEKLARDVYTTLGSIWGMKIFSNIASSEQTHTDAVKTVLLKYDIKDPVIDDTVGVFVSKDMQDLYNKLVAQGEMSLLDALIVGATVEDLDIRDLEILKKETKNQDILIVYENLQKGSRNHIRAFVKNIEANGGTYKPQYISDAEYRSIISTTQEKGRY
jgi:rhodanese-related sulfurtransferase